MRLAPLALLAALALAACAGAPPFAGIQALGDPAEADRRGAVEIAVKSAYPGILNEIAAGGGPALTAAMDAARIPAADRPARLLQLEGDRGLYEANPGALALTLFTYGS